MLLIVVFFAGLIITCLAIFYRRKRKDKSGKKIVLPVSMRAIPWRIVIACLGAIISGFVLVYVLWLEGQ